MKDNLDIIAAVHKFSLSQESGGLLQVCAIERLPISLDLLVDHACSIFIVQASFFRTASAFHRKYAALVINDEVTVKAIWQQTGDAQRHVVADLELEAREKVKA